MIAVPAPSSAFVASDRLLARAGRALGARRYLVGSFVAHAVVVALVLPHVRTVDADARAKVAAAEAAQDATRIAQTQDRSLRQRVERMERIRRTLEEAAGVQATAASAPGGELSAGDSPAALARRARAAAQAIDTAERHLQASAISRLTGQQMDDVLRSLEAEAARREAGAKQEDKAEAPAQAIDRLDRRAREAMAGREAQLAAQRDGVQVTRDRGPAPAANDRSGHVKQRYPADGIPRSEVEQMASILRRGEADGRVGVVGTAAGRSINHEHVVGVAGGRVAKPDDPPPDATRDGGLPVTPAGVNLDLTSPHGGARHDGIAYVDPPAIVPATLRTGAGRRFGPGGAYATRVYLDTWYVLGPFDATGEQPLETPLAPEEDPAVDLDAAYRGKDGKVLRWRYASRGFYPFLPPTSDEHATWYAWTELMVDKDRDVWLDIGADDHSKLWLDGRQVWVSAPVDKPWYRPPYYLPDEQVASLALAEGHRRVHLRRGRHQLLLKLVNDRDKTFFSVVVAP